MKYTSHQLGNCVSTNLLCRFTPKYVQGDHCNTLCNSKKLEQQNVPPRGTDKVGSEGINSGIYGINYYIDIKKSCNWHSQGSLGRGTGPGESRKA